MNRMKGIFRIFLQREGMKNEFIRGWEGWEGWEGLEGWDGLGG